MQDALGVPDEADRDVLRPGRDVPEAVGAGSVRRGAPPEVREQHRGPRERLTGRRIPHLPREGGARFLDLEEDRDRGQREMRHPRPLSQAGPADCSPGGRSDPGRGKPRDLSLP